MIGPSDTLYMLYASKDDTFVIEVRVTTIPNACDLNIKQTTACIRSYSLTCLCNAFVLTCMDDS